MSALNPRNQSFEDLLATLAQPQAQIDLAIGMAWIARVSRDLLGLDPALAGLHDDLLGGLGLPLSYPASYDELRPIMSLDKKARGTTLRLVGITAQGHPAIIDAPDEVVLRSAYEELVG